MRRRALVVIALALFLSVMVGIVLINLNPRRRASPLRAAVTATSTVAPIGIAKMPVEEWSRQFRALEAAGAWPELEAELSEISESRPDLYERFDLRYLHARVRIETENYDLAAADLERYLEGDTPLRDLALYHRAVVAELLGEDGEASEYRQRLVLERPSALYASEALETELEYLGEEDPAKLLEFLERIPDPLASDLTRDLEARRIEALWSLDRRDDALRRALALLRRGTTDDAAERVVGTVAEADAVRHLPAVDLALLGDAAQNHRHYDRAVELLQMARPGLPAKQGDLLFAIGRSHFGAEEYERAEQIYLEGAAQARRAVERATFLFHAARAAQLRGDDARAETLLTRAIAVRGNFPATSAALTQRMRTRLSQRRWSEALSDLRLIERLFGRKDARVESAIDFANYEIANGRYTSAYRRLDAIPRSQRGAYDEAEIDYWRGRAVEPGDARAAVEDYLEVLRADVSTHYAYFARRRLQSETLRPVVAEILQQRRERVASLIAQENSTEARRVQADVVLLSNGEPAELQRLAELYRAAPAYAAILDLEPHPFPSLPLDAGASRGERLVALGLFDDASDWVGERWGLRSNQDAYTRAIAFNLGAESRASIQAAEILMRRVPDDFVPELLPRRLRELLYPRYYYPEIVAQAQRHEADPMLVLSIMREESRFNPRAKSAASARGLLQFIVTTARDIGRSVGLVSLNTQDLYDPSIVIQLGAKYVGDLMEEFDGDSYRAVGAYNAGPYQVKLWSRIAPGPEPDYFLGAVNFSETAHYIRKVMNSYERYREIYEGAPPVGGIPVEP